MIVCEGEKTEPLYFLDLIRHHRLNTANVEIDGSCSSSPINVFDRASALWEIEESSGDPFDRVYCVIDRDSHPTYEEVVKIINEYKPEKRFYLAESVPCFEYWLLLHFIFSTRPYAATGRLSVGDEALKHLRNYMPDYNKGRADVYTELLPQVGFAIANAARSMEQADANHTDNPSTKVGELVEILQQLKS